VYLPFTLILGVLSRWSGRISDRIGARWPLVVGPAVTALSLVMLSASASYVTILVAMTVLGCGMALTVAPLTTTVMGAVDQRHAGIASGINNSVSRAAGLLAIAVLGIVALGVFSGSLDSRLAPLQLSPQLHHIIDTQRIRLAAIQIPSDVPAATRAALKNAIDQAFVSSFRVIALVCSGLALASAVCSWLLIGGRHPRVGQEPVRGDAGVHSSHAS
jgi:MFS family permease